MLSSFGSLCARDQAAGIEVTRIDQGWHIAVDGVATFVLTATGDVNADSVNDGVCPGTLTYLRQNLLTPLAHVARGEQVLHCSAVHASDGALLFVTETGCGKSTLAGYLARHGFALMADDFVVFEQTPTGIVVAPTSHALRLWDDSLDALDARGASHQPGGEYTRKYAVSSLPKAEFCATAQPVQAVLVLGDGHAKAPLCRRFPPAEALYQVLPHLFRLPGADPAAQLRRLAAALDGVPVYELDYPTRYDVLPDVAALLREL